MIVPVEVARNAALALPPVRALAARRWRTGVLGDPGAGEQALSRLSPGLDRPLAGAQVLELGPGKGLGLADAALARGASYAASDVVSLLDAGEVGGRSIDYRVDPAGRLSWPDRSFDVVWSYSVLEHVREPEVLLRDVVRVLRPDGRFVSFIDLTTHSHGRRDPERMFEFLGYSSRTWELMASRRSIWVNRLRRSDWRGLFRSAGLRVVLEEPELAHCGLAPLRQVRYLDHLSDEDVLTRHLILAATPAA